MDWLTWSILLLLLGLVLLVAELFLPSGGVLGALAGAAIICSLVCGFLDNTRTGAILLATVMVLVPGVLVLAVRYWPDTPLGRLILIPRPEHQDDLLPDENIVLKSLIRKTGIARTKMLPGGVVEIGGQNYNATSEGEPIDPGTPVVVLRVDMHSLIVRAAAESLITADHSPPAEGDSADPLNQGIESLGFDPNEDPLA